MRIFAGPNGSGKSTIQKNFEYNTGSIINADEILNEILNTGNNFSLEQYKINVDNSALHTFICNHGLYLRLQKQEKVDSSGYISKEINVLRQCKIEDQVLHFPFPPASYAVAIIADFIRHSLLSEGNTFSFETVFSHADKVDFIIKANDLGYRTYLYFIATDSVEANIARVKQWVKLGGHPVPEEKIRSRYEKSLENLLPAIRSCYRSYIFDNTGSQSRLFATVSPDKFLSLKVKSDDEIPIWFSEYCLDLL